jgi:FlaG/FlaF family flagellin (archaellin)
MRTITRIRRSIRAISPVISVLLMIAIAVVASLVVYAWVMGYIGFQTGHVGKAVQIQSVARDGTAGNLVVYVQNVGQGTVKLDPASSLYANDTNQASTIDNPTLAPGQTATITALNYPVALTDLVKVKVVTGDGTYSQVTQAPQGNGGSSGSTCQVSFAVGAGGGGSTSPSVSMSYDAGASVPILATPDGTHTFSQWTADTGSITFDSATSASTNAHINGAGTITATFALAVQQVIFVSAGSGSGSTNGNPAPGYPTSLQANDLILLQVTVRGDSTPTITVPNGFALLRGPDATGGSSSRVTQWIYYKFSTGSESGTGTVTITGTNYDRAARMYAFRNVALTSFTEGAGYRIGEDDVILAQSVTTTGIKRLAVTFVSVENDISVGSFTGGSGGTWTEPVSEFTFNGDDDICMQLQTATMANAGTIQNGSYDTGSTSYRWVVTAFALIPR